jgi:short-subunit dehydrogenase
MSIEAANREIRKLRERAEQAEAERDNWRAAYYAAKHSYQSYVARLEAILERDEVKATERIPERITSEPHEKEKPQ